MRKTGIMWAAAALALAVALLAACNEDLLGDPSFDRWCGEMLCNWQLDDGRIEQVASWHARDYAVELVEKGTQLSQLSEEDSVGCIRFEMIVDADTRAQLSLQLDFNDDETIDVEHPIPGVRWKRLVFHINPPETYEKVRFILRKDAEGRAVVGQLRARPSDDCTGARVVLSNQRSGAACREHDECSFGLCTDQRCASCREDADCGDSQLCVSGACSTCREDADCETAEPTPPGGLCFPDGDCASGRCCDGTCAASADASCD